jgi:thiol-disulfide isomerase/thioredoxin
MLTLTAENFDEAKDSADGYLVEFYAPWCGACKAFSSEMSKTATALKGITPVGAIDGTEHRELMSAHGSRGYPSIILFKGGERTEYTGARKSATLVKWVRRRTQGLESVTSFADLPDAGPTPLADSGTTVIAVFPTGGASTELGDVFLQAALDDDSREYITCMNDADVTAMCGGEGACVVLQTPLRPQTLPITWGWKVRRNQPLACH